MNDPIEEALQTYPMAEPPADLSKKVMDQIRLTQAPIRFRLTWMDYALGLFLSLIPITGFIAIVFIPRQVVMRMQYEWLVLHSPAYQPIFFTTVAGLALWLIIGFIASVGFLYRPQRLYRIDIGEIRRSI